MGAPFFLGRMDAEFGGRQREDEPAFAGIEPLEDTLKAVDYTTSLGAFPTVCVFRPTIGSDMEYSPSPRYEELLVLFQHVHEACRRNHIPMDVTPNIEVSLVVQPGDTRYLAPPTWKSRGYNLEMRLLKWAAQPYFWWKRRPRSIAASEVISPER